MNKNYYIETHGCQMNVHDSEKVSNKLSEAGYVQTLVPVEADLIILNTCMVREKPEQKVFKRINYIKHLSKTVRGKKKPPVFGVMGCVAQAEAERIFERSSDVSLVLGTQSIGRIQDLLDQLEKGFPRAIDVRLTKDAEFVEINAESRTTENIAYISIIEGCNKFCSFCIVPYTRGRERSRMPGNILEEARELAEKGYQEIHLLGQNVNSYGLSGGLRGNLNPGTQINTDKSFTFSGLLELLARESGVRRIKFMTSHPRDFDSEIVRVIDENINLCEWIHLPVQSGSDRVLRMMRRGYTRGEYLQKIQLIKNASRSISITSDIIIGFPGETDQDFAETLNLVSEVEFDGLYIFKYSPRPKTPASAYPDSVSDEVKAERFMKLQELQMRLQKIKYAKYIGVIIEVLVEGGSTRSKADMFGHSRCNKIVNFPCDSGSLGKIVNVRVTGVRQNSLYGTIV